MQKQLSKEKGFTIIEVVLVLAIAGLIFLIVFLALPQLQRSRRDTQRRGDAGKVISALESYASNAGGDYPTTTSTQDAFEDEYIVGADLQSPDNTVYDPDWSSTAPADTNDMQIRIPGVCNGSLADPGSDDRDVAVAVKLEEGTYCQDNQ